jgi:hypothetical protein
MVTIYFHFSLTYLTSRKALEFRPQNEFKLFEVSFNRRMVIFHETRFCIPCSHWVLKFFFTETTILFSVIVISLSADLLVLISGFPGSFQFLPLALSTTLLSASPTERMGLLALSLNTISSLFAFRLVIDCFRHGSIFSYIVVEIVLLCKFFLSH